MNKLTLAAYAKINLSLDITGTRADGYHLLSSIFTTVSLFDEITISTDCQDEISVFCGSGAPCGSDNLCHKAASLFMSSTGKRDGISIDIVKHIPSQAGLGGGSSDAAATLNGLNILFDKPLSDEELRNLASSIGADVPFFISGGTAFVHGIGEIITALPPLENVFIALAKGENGISTPLAYRNFDALDNPVHTDESTLLSAFGSGDMKKFCELCVNSLELCAQDADIQSIKRIFAAHSPLLTLMSGSGSAVFGLYSSKADCKNAVSDASKYFSFSDACTPVSTGFSII